MLTIDEIESLPFLFIVGRGRSGTTLLQTILDANPNVILPSESRIIIFLKKKYFPVKNWTPKLIDKFIADLYKEKEFSRSWNINKEKLRHTILSFPLNKLSFKILCKIIYLSYLSPFKKTTILLIGDKKPMYSLFLKDMIEVFPDAKFIHLIRDYRDNIVSNRKSFTHKNVAHLAYGWKSFNTAIDKEKHKNEANFYTLKYEDLASFPEKYIVEICNFLNIPFYREMLDFHKKVNDVYNDSKPEAIARLHSNMLNPVNTTQINKWKKELTINEIELADFIAGNYAKKYGYQPLHQINKTKYYIKAIPGFFRDRLVNFIFKIYYNLPISIRNISVIFFNKMYVYFGYTNFYNSEDYKSLQKNNSK
jgi:hypothetical protein